MRALEGRDMETMRAIFTTYDYLTQHRRIAIPPSIIICEELYLQTDGLLRGVWRVFSFICKGGKLFLRAGVHAFWSGAPPF